MGHTDKVTVNVPHFDHEAEEAAGILAYAISGWNAVLQPLGMRIVLDIRLETADGEAIGAEEGSE